MSRMHQKGFSVMQLVIIAVVASAAAAMFIVGGEKGSVFKQYDKTLDRMAVVESAFKSFKAANGRLPCPADGSLDAQNAGVAGNFGVEAANEGDCTGGTPAANLGPDADTNEVVAGVIPTKTLNLPDEYMFDAWGRRLTYVVDRRATERASCSELEFGAITINDSDGSETDKAMMAMISHSKNGHGAFPQRGSNVAGRVNAGSADTDEQNNASVDGSFAASFDATFVSKEGTSTFDDIVRYQKSCCVGPNCAAQDIDTYGETSLFIVSDDAPRFIGYEVQENGTQFTKLPDPDFFPPDTAYAVDVAPGGGYVTAGFMYDPFIYIYKRVGTALTQIAPGGMQPVETQHVLSAVFSNSVDYLALGTMMGVFDPAYEYLTIYKRSADTFTEIPMAVDTQPIGDCKKLDFSPDDTYLACAPATCSVWPTSCELQVYKRSGDSFTKLSDLVPPAGPSPWGNMSMVVDGVDFSSSGNYLAVGGSMGSSTLLVYKYDTNTDVFTLLPAVADASLASFYSVSFSNDTRYLAGAGSAGLVVYKRTGDAFTLLPIQPDPVPMAYDVAFSSDDGYVAVGLISSPYVAMFQRAGDTFTKLADPADLPAGPVREVSFLR